MVAERSKVVSAGPEVQAATSVRRWPSVHGWWPAGASLSDDAVSAALRAAPTFAQHAARRAARQKVRRDAFHHQAARGAALNVLSAAGGNALDAAVKGSGNGTPTAVAGPGIAGLQSN